MRLACGDNAFPLLPLEVAISLIGQMGFEGFDVTLASNSTHLRPDAVLADMPRWVGWLEEHVVSSGLQFADVVCLPALEFKIMAVNSPDPEERRRGERYFRGMLDFASRLGAPGLTMLPGVAWPQEEHAVSLRRAAMELECRAVEARQRGLRFSIEPHIGSVCQTPRDVASLCEMAPNLELTFDYSHFIVQGFDPVDVEPLLTRARHVHMRGANRERLQASFKRSTIDYGRLVDALRANGYDGYLAIEYLWIEWAHLNEVDVVSETVLLRDCLLAKLSGKPWQYPDSGGVHEAALD
jgi:sugar phosphate isomerase/epimerase